MTKLTKEQIVEIKELYNPTETMGLSGMVYVGLTQRELVERFKVSLYEIRKAIL